MLWETEEIDLVVCGNKYISSCWIQHQDDGDRTHTAAASSEDMSATFEATGDSSSYIWRWFCQVDSLL